MTRLLLAAAMLLVFDAARAQGAPCAQGQEVETAPHVGVLAQEYARAVDDDGLLASPSGACEVVAANRDGTTRRTPRRTRTAAPSHRFDMTQNGKRMSAADFDKWMKARGIRVATGKPAKPKPKR